MWIYFFDNVIKSSISSNSVVSELRPALNVKNWKDLVKCKISYYNLYVDYTLK